MDREEIRKLTEKELEELTPELPEGFEDWCSRQMEHNIRNICRNKKAQSR